MITAGSCAAPARGPRCRRRRCRPPRCRARRRAIARASAEHGVVVDESHGDRHGCVSNRVVVPAPGSERMVRCLDCRGPGLRAHAVRSAVAPETASGSKPMPSSVTVSTSEPCSSPRSRIIVVARAWRRVLRTTSCATRQTRVDCCSALAEAGGRHDDLHAGGSSGSAQVHERGRQRRGIEVGRMDLDEQRAQRTQAPPQGVGGGEQRRSCRLVGVARERGDGEGRAGEVLDHPVVQVARDAPSLAGRRGGGATQQPLAFGGGPAHPSGINHSSPVATTTSRANAPRVMFWKGPITLPGASRSARA